MPYKLRKVPKKDLYWVIGPDGKHHSKEGLPRDKAEAQKRALESAMGEEKGGSHSKLAKSLMNLQHYVTSIRPDIKERIRESPDPDARKQLQRLKKRYDKMATSQFTDTIKGHASDIKESDIRRDMSKPRPPPRFKKGKGKDRLTELLRGGADRLNLESMLKALADMDDDEEMREYPPVGGPGGPLRRPRSPSPPRAPAPPPRARNPFGERPPHNAPRPAPRLTPSKRDSTGKIVRRGRGLRGGGRSRLRESFTNMWNRYKASLEQTYTPESVRAFHDAVMAKLDAVEDISTRTIVRTVRANNVGIDTLPEDIQQLYFYSYVDVEVLRMAMENLAQYIHTPYPFLSEINAYLTRLADEKERQLIINFGNLGKKVVRDVVQQVRYELPYDRDEFNADTLPHLIPKTTAPAPAPEEPRVPIEEDTRGRVRRERVAFEPMSIGKGLKGGALPDWLRDEWREFVTQCGPAIRDKVMEILLDDPSTPYSDVALARLLTGDDGGAMALAKAYGVRKMGQILRWIRSHAVCSRRGRGKGKGNRFHDQIRKAGMEPSAYLEEAKRRAKAHGYPSKLLGFSHLPGHKLAIPDSEGKMIHFGKPGYGDFLLWSHSERTGSVPKGTAEAKRRRFQASHTKMPGDWKGNPFSPNNLALHILW